MRGKAYGCNYFAGEKLLIELNKCTFYTTPSLDLNVSKISWIYPRKKQFPPKYSQFVFF
jgi:hypothetical protein